MLNLLLMQKKIILKAMIKEIKDYLNELRVASYFYEDGKMNLDGFKRVLVDTQKNLPNGAEEEEQKEIIS